MCIHLTVARVNDPQGPVINSSVGIDASVQIDRGIDASVGTEDVERLVDASVGTEVDVSYVDASVGTVAGKSLIKKMKEEAELQLMHGNLGDKKTLDAFVSQSKVANRCLTANTT